MSVTGTYVNGRLVGKGLLLTDQGDCIDGEFADELVFMGKGSMHLASGDTFEGLITGDWRDAEGVKVCITVA